METTEHRSTPEPPDPAFADASAVDPANDIISQVTARVGELYAEEARRQRKERTERLISRASAATEE